MKVDESPARPPGEYDTVGMPWNPDAPIRTSRGVLIPAASANLGNRSIHIDRRPDGTDEIWRAFRVEGCDDIIVTTSTDWEKICTQFEVMKEVRENFKQFYGLSESDMTRQQKEFIFCTPGTPGAPRSKLHFFGVAGPIPGIGVVLPDGDAVLLDHDSPVLLAHEYIHHLQGSEAGFPSDKWLREGGAEAVALSCGELVPRNWPTTTIKQILETPPNGDEYRNGALLQYFLREQHPARFQEMVRAMRDPAQWSDFKSQLSNDPQLNAEFQKWVSDRKYEELPYPTANGSNYSWDQLLDLYRSQNFFGLPQQERIREAAALILHHRRLTTSV